MNFEMRILKEVNDLLNEYMHEVMNRNHYISQQEKDLLREIENIANSII